MSGHIDELRKLRVEKRDLIKEIESLKAELSSIKFGRGHFCYPKSVWREYESVLCSRCAYPSERAILLIRLERLANQNYKLVQAISVKTLQQNKGE